MARSDGDFPYYRHLPITIDEEPEGWKNGARRCMKCDRLYPNHDAFKVSPCCNSETGKARRVLDLSKPGAMKDAVPQMTWAEAVQTLLHWRFELLYQTWNEGLNDQELYLAPTEEIDEESFESELEDIDHLLREE